MQSQNTEYIDRNTCDNSTQHWFIKMAKDAIFCFKVNLVYIAYQDVCFI